MNKERRKKLSLISKKLEIVKSELESILDEEQDCFDNMPENLQYSIRGSESEECIDIMDDAISNIEDIIDSIGGM